MARRGERAGSADAGTRLPLDKLEELHGQVLKGVASNWRRVFCLSALAELYAESGHDDAARQLLASITAKDRQAFYAPEVYRLEGELFLRSQAPPTRPSRASRRRSSWRDGAERSPSSCGRP